MVCAWTLLCFARPAAAQDQRAVLELVVNGVASGESLVVLRDADALVPTAALAEAGLARIEGRRHVIAGREFVSMASLAPRIVYSVDEVNLRLAMHADPDLLGRHVRNLSTGAPAGLQYRSDASAFVNYSVNYRGRNQVDLFTESAVSARGMLFYSSASATPNATVRGLTNVTVDQRRRMRRWTVGDALGYSGALGGDTWLAGVTVSREFAIDPYFVRHPTLSLSTPIAVPSVMEVHVNGQIVRQEPVPAGRLDVTNLPLTLGRNDARVVVRDAFGSTRELSSTYYLTTSTLSPGVHDYQYSVGFRRQGLGADSWQYRYPVALARHRVGVTDSLTLGGRAEVQPGKVFSAGPAMNVRLPLGEMEAAVSMSRADRQWGIASLAAFSYTGRPVSAGGSVMVASRRYTTLTARLPGQDPAVQSSVFASAAVTDRVSVTLQHSLNRLYEGISRSRTGVLSTIRLGRNIELTASVTSARDERTRARESYVGLTVLFGRRSASVSHTRDQRGGRAAVDVQQPLPAGVGYGYQVRAEDGAHDAVTGTAQYQGPHGRYEIRQEQVGDTTATTLSAMGAVVAIGGGVHATRPVQNSFALIRVPGVEGVRAFASNQEIGTTGRRGELLVPDLQAYYGNTLDIADSDIPLDYSVPGVRLMLAPPYRGGAIAQFDVTKLQRVVGKVRLRAAGGETTPAYGELTVTAGRRTFTSPIGSDGSFYFEDLPAGTHPAVIQTRDGACHLTIGVPSSAEPVVKLGIVECTPGSSR